MRLAGILLCSSICWSSQIPAGVVTSSGSFLIDGSSAANSGTMFEGNSIECPAGCTIRRPSGARIELLPHAVVVMSPSGIVLTAGEIRIEGLAGMAVADTPAEFHPSQPDSLMRASFLNGELTLDVVRGSELLSGKEIYARLGQGSRMVLVRDPKDPAGLRPKLLGCLHQSGGRWFLSDSRLPLPVEVTGEGIRKDGRRVELLGSFELLPSGTPELTAKVRTITETQVNGGCSNFKPITLLVPAGVVAAAGAALGQSPGRVSVP